VVDESFYLIDQLRDRLSFSDTLVAIRKFAHRYPQSMAHLIEEKANGSAIIDVLQNEIPSLIPVLPQGGKEARAHAIESLWSLKRVYLPPPEKYPWVADLIQEIIEFPSSLNDDQVDAMTQGLTWLRERTLRLKIFQKSMANIGDISCFL
jgi:predicted phage terminase large subunit-like protein